MKILVGMIGNDAARFHLFTASVMKLDTSGLDVDQEFLIGGDWCGARNELVEMTLEGDYTHLWFMDDDHAFAPDLLKRLVAHDVHVINPLCLARAAPFPLVNYAPTEDGTSHLPIDLTGLPGEGLVEVAANGCAGMLIHRKVLEATGPRWFEYSDKSEDVLFCEKARAKGFKIYVDLAARLGHITTTVVYPDLNEGNWMTRLKIGGGLDLYVSPAQDWQAQEEAEMDPENDPPVASWQTPESIASDEPVEPVVEAQTPCGVCRAESTWTRGIRQGCDNHPPESDEWGAERIELWVDADLRWWWRALDYEGAIIAQNSTIRESNAIEDAHRAYPGTDVHVIRQPTDDSRNPKQYGPPTRLWDKGG